MNEFEALKRLRQETCPATYMPDFDKEECCDVIEKALLELKAIKEAKPNEALEYLEEIRDFRYGKNKLLVCQTEMYHTIKQALLKAEKLEKVWEVVKEHLIFEDRGTETYANKTKYLVRLESKDTGATIHIHLDTQEDADLLKGMLENDMNRLTEKLGEGFYVAEHAHNTDEVTHKLGKFEDLEEELGCPLEVLVKAMKDGFWFEKNGIGFEKTLFQKGFFRNLSPSYNNLTNSIDVEFEIIYGVRFCYNWKEDMVSYNENDIINPYGSKLAEKSYAVNLCTYHSYKLSDYKKTWWLKEDRGE